MAKDIDPTDPEVKRLFDEALQAAPSSYVKIAVNGDISSEDTVAMLPRRPLQGQCRLCGKVTNLTKEHIPPRASGNKERLTHLSFDDWLRDRLEENPNAKHLIEQGAFLVIPSVGIATH